MRARSARPPRGIPAPTRLLLAATPALGACYVFSSASIDQTCDELDDCGAADTDSGPEGDADTDADSDSDTDADVDELGAERGIVLSISDSNEDWFAFTLAPSNLDHGFTWKGEDALAGPVARDKDREVTWIAATSGLWSLSDGGFAQHYEGPDAKIQDLAIGTDGSLYAVTVGALHQLVDGELTTVAPRADWGFTGLRRVVAVTGSGLILLDPGNSDAGPSILSWDGSVVSTLVEGFDTSGDRSAGGSFIGPDGTLMACSRNGEVFTIPDLAAATANGTTPTPIIEVAATVSDVIYCDYDPGMDAYLVGSENTGIWLVPTSGEGDSHLLDPQDYLSDGALFGMRTW